MLGEREEGKWQVTKVEEERKRIIDEGEEKVEGEGKGERVGEKEKKRENERRDRRNREGDHEQRNACVWIRGGPGKIANSQNKK